MAKLMKNYEAYLYNQHTGEVRKLSHFTKNHIKNQITNLGDENDVNFEIHFYNEIGEKIKPDFTTKDLNVYMKELSKHLTK